MLAEIDSAGTRSIVVRADVDGGMTAKLLDQLSVVAGVATVTGLGPIVDARNSAFPGGPSVPVRHAYGVIGDVSLEATSSVPNGQFALASRAGMRAAGIADGTGGLVRDDGVEVVVRGALEVPAHLAFLEPLVVVPSSTASSLSGVDPDAPLTVLVVLAKSPPEVAAVEEVVGSLLYPPDRTAVTIETSTQLAAIRAAIGGKLGTHGRGTVLGILAVSTLLVAVNLMGMVVMRRKDFGRRRALGATRSLIVGLVLGQVTVLAVAGVLIGTLTALGWLAATDASMPGAQFTIAVDVAGVLAATLGAVVPALVAAQRDPLHELRVP